MVFRQEALKPSSLVGFSKEKGRVRENRSLAVQPCILQRPELPGRWRGTRGFRAQLSGLLSSALVCELGFGCFGESCGSSHQNS